MTTINAGDLRFGAIELLVERKPESNLIEHIDNNEKDISAWIYWNFNQWSKDFRDFEFNKGISPIMKEAFDVVSSV